MKLPVKNQYVLVHAYKNNGTIYRIWDSAFVYEVSDEKIVLINDKIDVFEINGRKWKTSEPAIWFFFKNSWFNIICMFKEHGINYYCNIASPFIYEEGAIKYIDYDLDVKVFNDNSYKILDLKEFNRNRIEWKYSQDLTNLIWNQVDQLKQQIKNKTGVFDHKEMQKIWDNYLEEQRKTLNQND